MEREPTYVLLDAGDGRRLERFGSVILDRPHPAADAYPRRDPGAWTAAAARFERSSRGDVVHAGWTTRDGRPIEPWSIRENGLQFELRLAPSGQVGWFAEQAANRRWVRERAAVARAAGPATIVPASSDPAAEPPAVLNLFGYTGGSTLAAALAGLRATHVDAARAAVAWARRNAELSGLREAPIRWIAEGATAFVRREARRGRHYAGIVLDPPTYGHEANGRDWRLERDLPPLLGDCAALLDDRRDAFVLLSAHTPGVDGSALAAWLESAIGPGTLDASELDIEATTGVRLYLGWSARWTRAAG